MTMLIVWSTGFDDRENADESVRTKTENTDQPVSCPGSDHRQPRLLACQCMGD
jgi:hypothetical protein